MGNWVKVCNENEVKAGHLFSFDHQEKKILVANLDGNLYATDRICTHEEADLSTGFLSKEGVDVHSIFQFLIWKMEPHLILLQKNHSKLTTLK